MIKATFKKNNNKIYWYQVTGHANFSTAGTDIVCAGVSSLYIALTNSLLSLGKTFERDEGYFILDATQQEDILLKALYNGINEIAKQYPDYVKVEG